MAYTALASGEITRRSYFKQVNALASEHDEIARRFAYRRDRRSLGHFALMLYDSTVRERFLLESCWPQIGRDGDSYSDLGINNDGRLVLKTPGRRPNLDFLVENETLGGYPLEVKFCPTQRFLTYKLFDLQNYLRTPDARVLTVASPDRMSGPNGDPDVDTAFVLPRHSYFLLMDHDSLSRLIEIGEHGNHDGHGGKDTVRILQRQFSQVATIQPIEELSHAH